MQFAIWTGQQPDQVAARTWVRAALGSRVEGGAV